MRDESKLDPVRRRLLELIRREGLDLKGLSLALGYNNAYLQQFIDRDSPKELKPKDAIELARRLKCDPNELFPNANQLAQSLRVVANQKDFVQLSGERGGQGFFTGARDLPILGRVRGGAEGEAFFIDNGEIVGYAMRPAVLEGVTEAYAVEVFDHSMEPVFKHGHQVWVNPFKAVKSGDDVILQFVDGQALIKTLVKKTDLHIVVRQYNPAQEIKFPRAQVKSLHLVVGTLRVPA